MSLIKISILFTFLLFLQSTLTAQIDFNTPVSLLTNQNTFEKLITDVSTSTGVQFSYSSAVIEPNTFIRLEKSEYKLQEFLNELSNLLYIKYIEFNGKILFVEMEEKWEEFWLYGYVRDASSGESIIGAVVYNATDKVGTLSNEFGYFSLKIMTPNSYVKVSSISYLPDTLINVKRDANRVDVDLTPRYTIPVIIVTPLDTIDSKYILEDVFQTTADNVNPSLFGERDIVQQLKFLPGIQSGSEVQGNLLVRGGGSDQNLMLMDGVPIYETNHLLGLTSIFNDEIINNVDVSTSNFSAKYGGRLSSVIDINVKNGNKYKYSGSASLGLLGAKIHTEGPINKTKTSYNFAARTTYINQFLRPLANRYLNVKDTKFGYNDLNLKLHHQLTKNNAFSINTYLGNDVMGFSNSIANVARPEILSLESKNTVKWSNRLINFRFDQIVNKKLFFTISTSIVNYNLSTRSSNIQRMFDEADMLQVEEIDVFANSRIIDNNIRTDWEYSENNDHSIKFGMGLTNHTYNPTVITKDSIEQNPTLNPEIGIKATEQFFYIEDIYDVSPFLSFRTGFHLSQFNVEEEFFTSFQPRLGINVNFNPQNVIDISYSKMTQFVHLLVNPGTGLPSDLWLPSTSRIPPENSIQYSLKYTRIWNPKVITYASVYYKQFENLIEYRSAFPLYNPIINGSTVLPLFENARDWEDRVEVGNGTATGFEAFISYKTNKWKANLSYGLGLSQRVFENINDGEIFPFKYDRRHDLSFSATYEFSDHFTFGVNWVFGTGHHVTFSTTQFRTIDGEIVTSNGDRNGFELPAYHRLDLNVIYNKKISESLTFQTSFGLYNAYSRLNPYIVYVYYDEVADESFARQLSLFPILPFINVSLKY